MVHIIGGVGVEGRRGSDDWPGTCDSVSSTPIDARHGEGRHGRRRRRKRAGGNNDNGSGSGDNLRQ